MGERRRSVRQKSFLRGCIYFNKRRGAVDCLIRDISDEGARVIFSDSVTIPDVVELHIPHKEQTLRARVRRRNGCEVGLAFGEAPGMLCGAIFWLRVRHGASDVVTRTCEQHGDTRVSP